MEYNTIGELAADDKGITNHIPLSSGAKIISASKGKKATTHSEPKKYSSFPRS